MNAAGKNVKPQRTIICFGRPSPGSLFPFPIKGWAGKLIAILQNI
jgi:hypothetical protein